MSTWCRETKTRLRSEECSVNVGLEGPGSGSGRTPRRPSRKTCPALVFRVRVCPMRVSRKNRRREKPSEPPRETAHTPHDALFHYTFGNVEHARPAIKSMLPAKIAQRIDFASMAVVDGHFVDRHLAQSQTDLLFSASIAGRPGLIYVLFEHQSSPEHFMTFRLLRYLLRIWENHLQDKPETKTLPVIIPLVLHHSPSGWTSPVRFEKLLDIDEAGLNDLALYVPRFGMVLHDISRANDDELMSRAITALAKITLLLFRHVQTMKDPAEIYALLRKYVKVLLEVNDAVNGVGAMMAVMRYIQQATHQSDDEVHMAMQQTVLIDEQTYNDIRYPGRREREEGNIAGRRAVLLEQLEERFGKVPAWATKRVNAAKLEELVVMSRTILRAQTIADVVGSETKSAPAKGKRRTPTRVTKV